METIINYYDDYDEDSRLVRDKAHTIEFVTTNHFMEKYITKESKVLEVGAGTGRYSLYYAEKGMDVTALDLSPKHVSIIKDKARERNIELKVLQGNALYMENLKDNEYDVVLCLGPLYHLMSQEEREACINECMRVLKPGGILALAYINRFATFVNMIHRSGANIRDVGLRNISKTGVEFGDKRDCFYHSNSREMECTMSKYNIVRLEHIGTDGIGGTLRDIINEFTEDEFAHWMEYHFETCRDESLIGYSQHGLYIGKRL